MKKSYTLWGKLKRVVRMRLIVPVLRSPHSPEYKARGVAVGLALAMTPLIGIQMWLVLMTWVFAKKVLKWNFSLALGIAWTWVTNVFTMIPCYYIFYVTGQLMRWDVDNITGYKKLAASIREIFMSDLGFVEEWTQFLGFIVKDWGISMMLGCLPWTVLCTYLGYRMTLKYEKARLARRKRKAYLNRGGDDYETNG